MRFWQEHGLRGNWFCASLLRRLAGAALSAVFLSLYFTAAASADDAYSRPPPFANVTDRNGMNLTTGMWQQPGPSVSIGPQGQGGLSYTYIFYQDASIEQDPFASFIKYHIYETNKRWVTVFGSTELFVDAGGGTWTSEWGIGGTLVQSGGNYTYTDKNGRVTQFTPDTLDCTFTLGWCTTGLANTMTFPNGEVWSFTWRIQLGAYFKTLSVTNNFGYQLKFNYNCSNQYAACYMHVDSVMAINNALEYCDPSAQTCAPSNPWPTLTIARSGGGNSTAITVTDSLSHVWTKTLNITNVGFQFDYVARVTKPTGQYIQHSYHEDIWSYAITNRTATDGTNTWIYDLADNSGVVTGAVYDPNGVLREVVTDVATGLPSLDSLDPHGINLSSSWISTPWGTMESMSAANGDTTGITYGARANVAQRANTGTGKPLTVTYAYPGCTGSNPKVCNQPSSITDANGNMTEYTYDNTHGGVVTVEGPAVNGARPLTTYNYTAYTAWYYTGPSTISQGSPIYLLSSTATCTTANTCPGTADERVTVLTYQAGNSSTPSNLLNLSSTVRSGNSAISATASSTYDIFGNVTSTTAPNSATTVYFYDADQRLVGMVQPDPDGGGGLANPATRTTYDAAGRVTLVEQGTTPSQSRYDFDNSFTSLVQAASAYDSVTGAKTSDTASIGGVVQSVTQYGYDAGDRPTCTARRQNTSSLPSDACAQSSGNLDQIAKTNYDAANRVTSVVTGVGSGTTITALTNGYDATYKGRINWVEDGKGNRSSFTYDWTTRRLVQINFPSKTTPGTSSATDYETYIHDGQGNMISRRLRSGQTMTMQYDALNRLKVKDVPGTSAGDVYYAYDLVGDLLSARYASIGGDGIVYGWDALGRKLSETSYGRTIASQYDASGNRTRLTYPDSNYIEYTYDPLNRMLQVKENGGTTLAEYTYDNLGRTASITRSNAATTSASYNGSSQSWSLSQDLASTGQDVTYGMGYSPAGQLTGRTISNGAYRYSVGSSVTTNSCANGLNQYAIVGGASGTCSGGTSYTYDDRGNLTSDGSRTFAYDAQNRLIQAAPSGTAGTPTNWGAANWNAFQWSGAATSHLQYDPLDRLHQAETPTVSTVIYVYDGDALVAEYNGAGTLLRRYVPGQGVDETLVWYEGANLASPNWLHTDSQGSVVAASNSSGVSASTYAYGPFGEPMNGFAPGGPVFRYTGQVQMPAIGLYYYKARFYDPALGRFLQTDPLGYAQGMNLYAYVMNDPMNATDPSGMFTPCLDGSDIKYGQDGETVGWCEYKSGCQGLIGRLSNGCDSSKSFSMGVINASLLDGSTTAQDAAPSQSGTNPNGCVNIGKNGQCDDSPKGVEACSAYRIGSARYWVCKNAGPGLGYNTIRGCLLGWLDTRTGNYRWYPNGSSPGAGYGFSDLFTFELSHAICFSKGAEAAGIP